jgi:hypothetical protein
MCFLIDTFANVLEVTKPYIRFNCDLINLFFCCFCDFIEFRVLNWSFGIEKVNCVKHEH